MYHINKEITGRGENITLQNTTKHYFKDFRILGNSKKEGTLSIDSEAPVESVGDNINSLAIQEGSWSTNGLTVNVKDNEINVNGTATTASNVFFTLKESLNLNGKYSFQAGNDIALTGGEYFRLYTGTTGYEVLVSFGALTSLNVKSENINISGTADRLAIRVNAGTVFNNVTFKPKLEKGTKATAYSPYGQGSIEIYNCNKNLFDKNDTNKILSAIPDGNTLKINSSSTARIFYIKCKPNTNYTISKLASKRLQMWDSIEKPAIGVTVNSVLNIDYAFSGTKKTVKTSPSAKYLVCYYYNSSTDTLNEEIIRNSIQLEEGETATEYIEHQSQIKALYTQQPFRAIGDVKDRFVKQNGVWYEEHNVPEIKLVGSDFSSNASVTEGNLFRTKALNGYLSDIALYSNYFKGVEKASLRKINTFYYNNSLKVFDFITDKYTSLSDFQTWVDSVELKVYPILETPKLIPCTLEQVEVLEYFEKEAYSYDEATHIYSTDEVSPYFEVAAYKRISEEFKTRLKEGKITRGYLKVLATDTLPEIIIDENNYLKDLKIEELRYVPEEGFIGGTVAKRVSGNFNNVDSSFDIQDREIEVYLGVELEDETTEYIKYGTYIVQRPEDDQVNDNTSFEALDYMIKFNQEYKDRITYPCTLKQLLDDIVDQAGVNSKVATFANSDFIVENNQFEQGSTLRDVLKAITQVAFNWSRIDADDNLVMDFEIREETDEELGTDDYFSFKKSDDYGPVNVIVLRNSQVEGENVTIKDEEIINSPKGYNLLNISKFIKSNLQNVDVKYNSDGSLLLNGTTDANSGDIRIIYEKPIKLIAGKYTFAYGIDGYEKFNNELNLASLGNGTYQLVKRLTQSFEKTIITFSSDFELYNYNIHLKPSTTFENYIIKPIIYKGEEEKPFQPYIPIGEIEYVIADNPFAYTELKRKQLIEAGRRLFGLKYTPMTVDMLGLMYLNSKDRITVENLNGQKYSTYLFDHTIDYTGIVLDSMESKAKTKTETKYQYVSSLAQGLSLVEMKVDKANKRIESIIVDQEDVSEKVAKTVARIEVVYASSDSPTTAPTDGWSTTAPEWVEGEYMWQKTITTYANGSTDETAVTNISGAQGKDGVSGNNSYSYVAFANSADGSKDFSRTDSTNKTYIGTLTINESVNENLLRNTNKGTTNWEFATQNGVVSKEQYTEEGKNAVKLTCTTASTGWQYASYSIGTEILKRLKENTNYILSFDIKTNIGPSTLEVAIKKGDSTNAIAQGVKADILGDETWEHFSVQLKTISDFSNITIGGQVVYFIGMNKVGYYIIENLKLEEGYRETSYSKSPEDLANDYTQYYWQYTKGEEGVGVSDVVDQYYSSTSNTEVTGGEWKETQDTLQTDRFIWTRSKITWTNGSVTHTNPILAATLNNINSNIIVFKEFTTTQIIENGKITDRVIETTKRLNNDYSTTEQVDTKINKVKEDFSILAQKFVDVERTAEEYVIKINEIDNNGVDKIKTRMGYTFNDEGLKIDRPGADTSTIIDEAKIKVTDKTGSEPKSLLYAGYVKEGDTEFSDYEGQTIVATSNLIVQNFLIIGSNSRFQDYYNETLGGNGTGAFDI